MEDVTGLNTTTTHAVDVPEVWDAAVLRAMDDNFVAAKLFARKDKLVATFGDKIHIPTRSHRNAVAMTEGKRLLDNLAANTDGEKTIEINKSFVSPFLISNQLDTQSMTDEIALEYWASGEAIAEQIDTDILAMESNFTTTNVGTTDSAIDNTTLTAAKEQLDLNKVPKNERFWILNPTDEKDLLDLSGNYFTSIDFSNSKSMVTGQVGRVLLGSPAYFTNNLPAKKSIYAHREAIGVAMQTAPKTEGEYNLDAQGYLGNVRTLYGVGMLREDFGVTIDRR